MTLKSPQTKKSSEMTLTWMPDIYGIMLLYLGIAQLILIVYQEFSILFYADLDIDLLIIISIIFIIVGISSFFIPRISKESLIIFIIMFWLLVLHITFIVLSQQKILLNNIIDLEVLIAICSILLGYYRLSSISWLPLDNKIKSVSILNDLNIKLKKDITPDVQQIIARNNILTSFKYSFEIIIKDHTLFISWNERIMAIEDRSLLNYKNRNILKAWILETVQTKLQ